MKRVIDCFEGQYDFLSNFYPSPFVHEGIIYSTNEHFFQAMKTLDIEKRREIAEAATPGQAKRMGRQVKLRADWEDIKDDVMRLGVCLKFNTHPYLRQKLIDTKPIELIEGNWWGDTYWGVCRGVGQNRLGKILMEERDKC